jgi:hypothetical protein
MQPSKSLALKTAIVLVLIGSAACSSSSDASAPGGSTDLGSSDSGAASNPAANDDAGSSSTSNDGGSDDDDATPPPTPAGAQAVACKNASGDAALVQAAVNAHAAVQLSGTCNFGSTTVTLPANVFLGGPATISYSGNTYAITGADNGDTVSQVTFMGGGIDLTSGGANSGWQIVFDNFTNITSGSDAVHVENILGKGAASSISNNTFKNIWSGGYPNLPAGKTPTSCNQENCLYGNAIFWHMGLDNTTIDHNTLDEIGYDGIKGFWDGFMGNTDPYTGHNVVISNNTITHYHRIGIEFQAAGQGNCPGGCNYNANPTDGTVAKGNFVYLPALTNNVFAFSFMVGGTNALLINNTGNNDEGTCYVRAGIGLENSMHGGTAQGNVIGSVAQSCYANGWADVIACGYANGTNYYQNNLLCGPGAAAQASVKNGQDPQDNATNVETADLWTDTCPSTGDISSSHIAAAFTSADNQNVTAGGKGTWNVAVQSNLSIRQVRFYVDASTTASATQEMSDMNSGFVASPKWLYHATIDVTSISAGSHTLRAVATDVSGASQTITQTFSR